MRLSLDQYKTSVNQAKKAIQVHQAERSVLEKRGQGVHVVFQPNDTKQALFGHIITKQNPSCPRFEHYTVIMMMEGISRI